MKNKFLNRYKTGLNCLLFVLFLVFAILFIDILTKILTDGISVQIWNGVFNFVSVHNTGGAWSILNEYTWILILLTFLFLIAFFIFNFYFKQRTTLYLVGFSLVVGGAIGNLIDRLFLGYVRDFISLDFLGNFPVFNIADICLCAGVIILCVFFLFLYPKLNKGKLKKNAKYNLSKQIKIYKKGSLWFFKLKKKMLEKD